MVPDRARRVLTPFFPGLNWEGIQIHVGRLPASQGLMVMLPRPLAAVTGYDAARTLQTVGVTIGEDIFLSPQHADEGTAAGLALLAHEVYHVEQGRRDPLFNVRYNEAAAFTPQDQPWENPFELPAYLKERDVYCTLVARGLPRGRWTPLGVTLWGC